MIMIGNETDLRYKVVDLIRRYYPDTILIAVLGENQDTEEKRLDSYKKGYTRGQPDLMVLNYHKDYKGLNIEFRSPTNNYHVSEAQKEMKKKYRTNSYALVLSNDYDRICKNIHEYMKGILENRVNIVSSNFLIRIHQKPIIGLFTDCLTNYYMNTVEADQVIKEYLAQQERTEQLKRLQLKKNLETFTVKELRKEVIAMKADKFAVTKMTRENIINLILQYRWLFPHLMMKTGFKRNPTAIATRRRRPLNKPRKQTKLVQTGIISYHLLVSKLHLN